MARFRCLFLLTMLSTISLQARESADEGETSQGEEVEQLKIGNFAVDGSQQPAPLVGFGQDVVDQGDLLAYATPDILLGCNKNFSEILPSILYGVTDTIDLFIEFPIALHFKDGETRSSGAQDVSIQVEYAFFAHKTPTATNQLTVVGKLFLPFGDLSLIPPTGAGSPSIFLGVTATHLAVNWYCYTSYAAVFTTPYDKGSKIGNQFLYEAGLGTNIAYSTDHWTFMWMVELYGEYSQRDKVAGVIDPNSGGNFVALVPSLFFSTQKITIQAGLGPVVSNNLFGDQTKDKVWFAFNFGWKFN